MWGLIHLNFFKYCKNANEAFIYFQDKHMLSRLLMLLNPNYASSATNSATNRNRRPTRKKKPIINVVEEETWSESESENEI